MDIDSEGLAGLRNKLYYDYAQICKKIILYLRLSHDLPRLSSSDVATSEATSEAFLNAVETTKSSAKILKETQNKIKKLLIELESFEENDKDLTKSIGEQIAVILEEYVVIKEFNSSFEFSITEDSVQSYLH